MFSQKPDKLMEEIDAAIKERDEVLGSMDDRIRQFHGEAFRDNKDEIPDTVVNHQFAYVTGVLPRLVYHNPKVSISPRRDGGASPMSPGSLVEAAGRPMSLDQLAMVMKAYIDTWSKRVDLASELLRIGLDYCLWFGVAHFTRKRHPGMSNELGTDTYMPQVERIPPQRVIVDPTVEDWRKARFIGHVWVSDKEDLERIAKEANDADDDSWDIEAIRGLVEDADKQDLGDKHAQHGVNRNEVVCYDLWVPEWRPDPDLGAFEGFHGGLVSVARTGGDSKGLTIIRKVRPYFGPPEGPYEIFGCYSVPKNVYPMSPTTATRGQETLLSMVSDEAVKSTKEYRKIVLVPAGLDSEDEETGTKIATLKDVVIPVQGMSPDSKPFEFEMGGVTDAQLKNIAWMERNLQRVSAMDEVQQGEVSGEGTATEHAIANQEHQTRLSYVIDRYREGVRRILRRVGYMLLIDDTLAMPIPDAAPYSESMQIPWVVGGGDTGEISPEMFNLLSIDIEPMSMERVTEAVHQRRVMQTLELITQIAPIARQHPEWDWQKILQMLGEALNLPDLGSLVDFEMMMQLVGVATNGAQPNPVGGGSVFGEGGGRETAGQLMGQALGGAAANGTEGVV